MHPGRSQRHVLLELRTVFFRKQISQWGESFHRHVRLPQVLQSLDDQAAHSSCRRHRSWSRPLQHDLAGADLYPARRPIGQKDGFGGHLFRQVQKIGRVGSRRLDAQPVTAGQHVRDGVHGRREHPQLRMRLRIIVQPPRQPPQDALLDQAMEHEINPLTTAQVEEIPRNEHRTSTRTANAGKDVAFKAFRPVAHGFHIRKNTTFFLYLQAKKSELARDQSTDRGDEAVIPAYVGGQDTFLRQARTRPVSAPSSFPTPRIVRIGDQPILPAPDGVSGSPGLP